MNIALRSALTAGVTAITASALVVAPSVAPPQPRHEVVSKPIHLAAAEQKLRPNADVSQLSPGERQTVGAAMQEIITRANPVGASPTAVPAPRNAASDFVTSAYQFIQYWVDYGVDLAGYVLGFIPFGYLISDQINIVYWNLVRPISDSVVYALINPVLNDPLNLTVWVNGAVNVGQTTVAGLVNTGIAEFNNFFGWLIPPLPPRPFPPLPGRPLGTTLAAAPTAAQADVSTLPAMLKTAIAPPQTVADAIKGHLGDLDDQIEIATSKLDGRRDLAASIVDAGTEKSADVVSGQEPLPNALDNGGEDVNTAASDGPDTATKPLDTADDTATKVTDLADRQVKKAVTLGKTPGAVADRLLRAQGKVTKSITKATADITKAAESGDPATGAKSAGDAPRKVVKGLGAGAAKAAKDGRKADKKAHSDG